jgi:heme exporter protein D
MEAITLVVLAALAVMAIQYKKTSARRVKRLRVRPDSRSSFRQTSVPDDRC